MNKFEVIIPVINVDLMVKLLESVYKNTLLPKRIIIINNSNNFTGDLFGRSIVHYEGLGIDIHTCYSKTGLCNESINLGITELSKDCDYVSILNDDVVLTKQFFQRNLELLQDKDCGASCPLTVHSMDELKIGKVDKRVMKRREGWALTIKKEVLDKIPLFPSERIATFHWDDWIWFHTCRDLNLYWLKDRGNMVFHHVGASVAKLGFRDNRKRERREFNKIGQEKKWGRT